MPEMRIDKDALFLRTMGISNLSYDVENKKMYSIQFYDYDKNGFDMGIPQKHSELIASIFPYDCIMYESKHGFHFISFSLLKGKAITKARALKITKIFERQDYWCSLRDLTLRIAPKWELNTYKNISEKPKFKGLIRSPNKYIISEKHLEFYHDNMGLPDWVYTRYEDCDKRDYKIKIVHYKTRD